MMGPDSRKKAENPPSSTPMSSLTVTVAETAAAKEMRDFIQVITHLDEKWVAQQVNQAFDQAKEYKEKNKLDEEAILTVWRNQLHETDTYRREFKYLEALNLTIQSMGTAKLVFGTAGIWLDEFKDLSYVFYAAAHSFYEYRNQEPNKLRKFLIDSNLMQFINTPMTTAYPEFKNTPLHLALGVERNSFAIALIQSSADFINPRIQDAQGKTAFLQAVMMGAAAVVDAFLTASFTPPLDINLPDSQGRTPLHYACATGRSDIVQKLLARGARKDLRDNAGKLPIEMTDLTRADVAKIFTDVGINADRDRLAPLNSMGGEGDASVLSKSNLESVLKKNEVDNKLINAAKELLAKLSGQSLLDFSMQGHASVREAMQNSPVFTPRQNELFEVMAEYEGINTFHPHEHKDANAPYVKISNPRTGVYTHVYPGDDKKLIKVYFPNGQLFYQADSNSFYILGLRKAMKAAIEAERNNTHNRVLTALDFVPSAAPVVKSQTQALPPLTNTQTPSITATAPKSSVAPSTQDAPQTRSPTRR